MNCVRYFAIAASLAALLLVAGCSKEEAKPSAAVVKIGLAAPITGPQAHIGIDIRNGTQLAVDDINAAGLTIGGKKITLQLVVEDDEANPTKAAIVARKLVDEHVVAVVGHFNSGASIPASKEYSDAGIPQISPSSTSPKYTQQGFKTTFRVVANDDQQGPIAAKFALQTLKPRAVAVIDDSTAYGQGLADTFTAAIKAGGAQVVAREHTSDKDTDFNAILTKIKGLKPDLIFFGGIDPQAAPMVKQMVDLGIPAKFMGGDGMQTPNFIRLAGSAAEGSLASMPGLPKDRMAGGAAFLAKYKAKYGAEVELFAPMGYDAIFVFVEAMKRANSAEPAAFLPEVRNTRYQGVIGPIAFDAKGDLIDGPITIYAVKEGKWSPLEVVTSGPGTGASVTAEQPAPSK